MRKGRRTSLRADSYRLGVFGFLNANTSDAPGNVGLLDQQLALSWVYNNIAAFNGDPNNFTQVPVLDEITVGTSEDCLHLNVWTPSILRCSTGCQPKPVIVFFYGRDFEHGFSDYQYYDGTTLSGFADVVVVVPSYRLGVFGFLNANTSDAPGNVGLLDQQLALSWVYNNIAAFNGDPNNVSIF
ncbi:hypothetical protein HPB50_023944 [Hyalomma asiaticum]|uniref:Uncharacterized protein n=1 Tax=Hyalomma asiaticum TaxID=266040 RepID=A0ACB7T9B4_HYAAI|nr:hypothetical protein HPB50_023944 [Hyalomma asiaticum]